jgi:hypothetical protein
MYDWQKKKIKVTEDSKILIGLGDSFTQGQGACSEELWAKYDWDRDKLNKGENQEVYEAYDENSWVNVLCRDYLTDYVPVNLGFAGRGNRFAVKELYLYPELNLDKAKEKIVVLMLSGKERFDLIDKDYSTHTHFKTLFPVMDGNAPESKLWAAYREFIFCDRFCCIETILNVLELQTWCKANNARLIITSGFQNDFDKKNYMRLIYGPPEPCHDLYTNPNIIGGVLDKINWKGVLYPKNFRCMSEYLLHLEGREDLINGDQQVGNFYDFASEQDKFTPKGFITKCGHPTIKGQEYIAETIYEFIKSNRNV